MIGELKEVVKKAKELDTESLEAIKYSIFVFIVADLFGVFWYFKLKKLGMALLIVFMILLTLILILERRKREEMDEDKKKRKEEIKKELKELEEEEKKDDKKDDDEDTGFLGSMGLPNAEEFNKRIEKALT